MRRVLRARRYRKKSEKNSYPRGREGDRVRTMGDEEHEEKVKSVELEGRGRGLVTARQLRGGEVIVHESPMLLYVASAAALTFCSRCLRKCGSVPTAAAPCPDCRAATFCSTFCRSSHSSALCSALRSVRLAALDDESEDQARFLLAAYHQYLVSPSEFRRLMLLDGAAASAGEPDSALEKLHHIVENAVRSWPWTSKQTLPSLATTASLLVKETRNAFGLMAPNEVVGQRSVRGFGFYPTASLINHDCLPNSCRFDYLDTPGDSSVDIYIRALHDIPENTEVTISYFPINWSFKDRQTRLTEEYGFRCGCERCTAEQDWTTDGEEEEEGDFDENPNTQHLHKPGDELNEEGGGGEASERGNETDDFDHAMFFVKYLCPVNDCGGTMAPLSSESPAQLPAQDDFLYVTMECNMCGKIRTAEEFRADLMEHSMLE